MEEKPMMKNTERKQVKEKPIYSSLYDHFVYVIGLWGYALIRYGARLFVYWQIHGQIDPPFPYEFVVSIAGGLIYLFLYKRRNYKYLKEDGLYYVREGITTHIPWEKVKSAKVIHKSVFNYIQADIIQETQDTGFCLTDKEKRFRHQPEISECFRRHMTVKGLSR